MRNEMPDMGSLKTPREEKGNERLSFEDAWERGLMQKIVAKNILEKSGDTSEMLSANNLSEAEKFLNGLENDAEREESMDMLTKKTIDFMNKASIGMMNLLALCMAEGPKKKDLGDLRFFFRNAQEKLQLIKDSANLLEKTKSEEDK